MDRFLRHLSSVPADTLSGLRRAWPEVVGPTLVDVSRPVALTDGILLITCDDATWAAQLKWMERTICDEVEARFPGVQVKGIQVRQRHQ